MLYSEMKIENDQLVTVKSKVIDQSKLTSDCWLIQFNGLDACTNCMCFNPKTGKEKRTCGGKNIRKQLFNK